MLVNALTLLGMVSLMFYIDLRFTLIALSIVPVLFLVVFFFTKRIKKASRAVRQKERELLTIVQEVFSSIRVVKAFSRENYQQHRSEAQTPQKAEPTPPPRPVKPTLPPV